MRDAADTDAARLDQARIALAGWYAANARSMPWRVGPADRAAGRRPDPYAVWLSEVMLQQTTVAAVEGRFRRFMARWPNLGTLASASDEAVMAEWAGLGYYARARNLLKCARAVQDGHGGRFPQTEEALRALPGIGAYTAAAVAAIAFDEPAVVVDGNVERVVARFFAVTAPLPGCKPALRHLAGRLAPDAVAARAGHSPGDHAQAMMDLGATVCTPRNPACGLCPLRVGCEGRALGIAARLPARAPKAPKPVRLGHAFVARRSDGALLLERRPPSGLLGGMPGWPGTEWGEAAPDPDPPLAADWQTVAVEVRHTFTHFHLRLQVHVATVGLAAQPARGAFVPAAQFRPAALPTLMRKVWDAARDPLAAP